MFDLDIAAPGAQHTQSQRFLAQSWKGLPGAVSDLPDPPLRKLVEELAVGTLTTSDIIDKAAGGNGAESVACQSFARWVSALRLVLSSALQPFFNSLMQGKVR